VGYQQTLVLAKPEAHRPTCSGALNRHSFWRSQKHIHVGLHVSRQEQIHMHIQQPYSHIQTRIQAHMHTCKHIHAAIRNNGREAHIEG